MWNWVKSLFGFGKSNEEDSNLTEVQISARKQIEFYFSPSNLQRDAFMLSLIDQGDDRYVPISIFRQKFNKIIELGISEEDLIAALQTSPLLEVDESNKTVRTKIPFKSNSCLDYQTIHIEGFDRRETLSSLRELLDQQYGQVNYVGMKNFTDKNHQRKFSGKVDVELSSAEAATEAAKQGFPYRSKILPVSIVADLKAAEQSKEEEPKEEKIPESPAKSPRRRGRPCKVPK